MAGLSNAGVVSGPSSAAFASQIVVARRNSGNLDHANRQPDWPGRYIARRFAIPGPHIRTTSPFCSKACTGWSRKRPLGKTASRKVWRPPPSNELTGVPLYPQNASHEAQENHFCMSQGILMPCDHLRFDVLATLCDPCGVRHAWRPEWGVGPLGPCGCETRAWRRPGKVHTRRRQACSQRGSRGGGVWPMLQRDLRLGCP